MTSLMASWRFFSVSDVEASISAETEWIHRVPVSCMISRRQRHCNAILSKICYSRILTLTSFKLSCEILRVNPVGFILSLFICSIRLGHVIE